MGEGSRIGNLLVVLVYVEDGWDEEREECCRQNPSPLFVCAPKNTSNFQIWKIAGGAYKKGNEPGHRFSCGNISNTCL